jgi:hypothetical protein
MSNTVETATIAGWRHTRIVIKGEIKNAWIVYSSDDKVFVTLPYRIHRYVNSDRWWDSFAFNLHQEGSTGTYEELVELLNETGNIEYDKSYKTGKFDQYDNPVAMLTQTAVYDLFFDNFSDRYGY